MSGRKITGLPMPETPKEDPNDFHLLVESIEASLNDGDTILAAVRLGRTFDYLTRFFCALAGAAARHLSLTEALETPNTFGDTRIELKQKLELLGEKATDPLSKLIRSVFFVGATRKVPTPRRHSRLLGLGGIPIRGYKSLEEWVTLEPGQSDLGTESKAHRELLKYLPILKEWLTASATFFLDASIEDITWASPSEFTVTYSYDGQRLVSSPIVLEASTSELLQHGSDKTSPGSETLVKKEEAEPEKGDQAPAEDFDTVEVEAKDLVGILKAAEEEVADASPTTIEPDSKPEREPESEPHPEPDSKPEREPESEPHPEPESKPEREREPESEPETSPEEVDVSLPSDESTSESDSNEPAKEEIVPRTPPKVAIFEEKAKTSGKTLALIGKSGPSGEVTEADLFPVSTEPVPDFFEEVFIDSDYPDFLSSALNDLNGAIVANDAYLIVGQLQRVFDLLIQFYAGLSAAILHEIDPDALFDFDFEGGRFTLKLKLDLLVTSLAELEEYWEGNDTATLVWSAFYDTLLPMTDPRSAYLHTRLLGVEGAPPRPFFELQQFCELEPGKGELAARSECRELAHRYLPILNFWLENSTPLFFESEVDTIIEDGGDALSWAATVTGVILDGTPSGYWLETAPGRWNLPEPELAPLFVVGDCPDPLHSVVEGLNSALERMDFPASGLFARLASDFLIQYFAGCLAALWREEGELSAQAQELYFPDAALEQKERLLLLALASVSQESKTGLSLAKVFPKTSLHYLALTRRDLTSEGGTLATWSQERGTTSKADLIKNLPILRSWLGASNAWFSASEQLFEVPSSDGRLEGVVAFEEDFLEMVDPEYVIHLCRETLELVAPESEFIGVSDSPEAPESETEQDSTQLPDLCTHESLPPILAAHLGRLQESLTDSRAANAWLGSALEYLVQYFAGLVTTALGGSAAPLSPAALEGFTPKSGLRARERLLVDAITYLKEAATGRVQEGLREVFVSSDGEPLFHTRCLGFEGPGSLDPTQNEMIVSYWCRQSHQQERLAPKDLRFGLTLINSWLKAADSFFSESQDYAEEPGLDGQEEVVVELVDDFFDLVLPDYAIQTPARGYYEVLYPESDHAAASEIELYFPEEVRPDLFRPSSLELGGLADDATDMLLGAAVDDSLDDLFSGTAPSSDDLQTPGHPSPTRDSRKQQISAKELKELLKAAEPQKQKGETEQRSKLKPKEATSTTSLISQEDDDSLSERERERRASRRRRRKTDSSSAVLEQYKKEKLEKARRRAEQRAKSATVQKVLIKLKLTYRGLKYSQQLATRCHLGLIEIETDEGAEVKGTVESAHPCVKVSPSRFEGSTARIIYQVDPSDMPSQTRVGLTINTKDERKEIRLDQLVPKSWFRERSVAESIGLLTAPSLLYLVWLILLTDRWLGQDLYYHFLDLHPGSESGFTFKLWVYGILAILPGATGVPVLTKTLFSRFDVTVQETLRRYLPAFMVIPSFCMIIMLYFSDLWNFPAPSSLLPPLAGKFIPALLTFGLNVLAASLFSLQTTIWWEDREKSSVARRTFISFWAITVLVGVLATLFLS